MGNEILEFIVNVNVARMVGIYCLVFIIFVLIKLNNRVSRLEGLPSNRDFLKQCKKCKK